MRVLVFLGLIGLVWSSPVALVDYASVLLMHPRMQNFHFPSGRFFKPLVVRAGDSRAEMRQRRNAMRIQAKRANSKREACLKDKTKLNSKLMKLARILDQDSYQQAEKKHLQSHRQKCELLARRALQQYDDWFLSSKGSQAELASILQEIHSELFKLRQERDYRLILPRSYPRDADFPLVRHTRLNQLSRRAFQNGLERLLSGQYEDRGADMDLWLLKPSLKAAFVHEEIRGLVFHSKVVVDGGEDVTLDVLGRLWSQAGFESAVEDGLHRALKAYLAGDDGTNE